MTHHVTIVVLTSQLHASADQQSLALGHVQLHAPPSAAGFSGGSLARLYVHLILLFIVFLDCDRSLSSQMCSGLFTFALLSRHPSSISVSVPYFCCWFYSELALATVLFISFTGDVVKTVKKSMALLRQLKQCDLITP